MKPKLTPKRRQLWNDLLVWLETPAKKRGKLKFNMGTWIRSPAIEKLSKDVIQESRVTVRECGSICCIGGFAILRGSPKKAVLVDDTGTWYDYESDEKAARYLGMTLEDARNLFYPSTSCFRWHLISAKKTAKVVRHYLKTGIVDWNVG